MNDDLWYAYMDSPIGRLAVVSSGRGIRQIRFPGDRRNVDERWIDDDTVTAEACEQLRQYFAGARRDFSLPLDLEVTDFQRRVLKAVAEIPYGETSSYAAIAARIGNPQAARAVGGANHANPVPIVIPCHRVIGADGSLTGFGGGIDTKARLLALEAGFAAAA